jgi:hypothetical protein
MVFRMAVPSAPVRKWPHVDSFVAMDFSCTESCNTGIPMFTSRGKGRNSQSFGFEELGAISMLCKYSNTTFC